MIDLLIDDGLTIKAPERIEEAVCTACSMAGIASVAPELCIRFASDQTVRELNHQWRDKDQVTDVLSFPMQDAPIDPTQPLGDIALAVPFIEQQAAQLALDCDAHILHLIIHATLHLLGFDHIEPDEAIRMQRFEVRAMLQMGLHHPYPEDEILQVHS